MKAVAEFHATPVFARYDWPARKESFANVGKVNSKGFDGNFSFKQKFNQVSLTVRGNMTYSKMRLLKETKLTMYIPIKCKGLSSEPE